MSLTTSASSADNPEYEASSAEQCHVSPSRGVVSGINLDTGYHLVPLDLGGAPDDPRNLWPEPWVEENGWGADRKDELEAVLGRLVCAESVSLAEAQVAIATDWIAAWRRYVAGAP